MKGIIQLAADLVCFLFYMPVQLLITAADEAGNIFGSSTGPVNSVMAVVDTAAKTGIDLVKPIAFLIAFMFFLFSMIELCMSDRLTVETFIKQFAYFIVGFALVYVSDDLYNKIRVFGDDFTTFLSTKIQITPTDAMDVSKKIEEYVYAMFGIDTGTYNAGDVVAQFKGGAAWLILLAMAIISSVVPLLASLAITIVMYVVAFSRSIEIGIRGAFLPIGLALMSEDGMKGAGMRYLKKFLAVCCQGIVIALVGKFIAGCCLILYKDAFDSLARDFSSLVSSILPLLKAVFGLAGFAVASIIMLFKSQQLITEVFGA